LKQALHLPILINMLKPQQIILFKINFM